MSFTPTLAQRLFPQRTLVREMGCQVAGVSVIAVLAQLSVPLWPVPVTGQTLGVLLVGAFLGFRRGSLATLLYVGLGAAGLPLFQGFSGGLRHLAGPTGGYLVGFVLSAGTAGLLAEHGFLRTYVRTALVMTLATLPVFVLGLAWLMRWGADDPLAAGLLPFLPGAAVKIALATAIAGRR